MLIHISLFPMRCHVQLAGVAVAPVRGIATRAYQELKSQAVRVSFVEKIPTGTLAG